MAYTDFSLETAEATLGVRARAGELFADLKPPSVPGWLTDTLGRGMQLAVVSEKARSEFIVAPILLASREISGNAFAIYSGQRLDVDPARGLSGECDFLLALTDPLPRLRAPIAAVVEAKKNDVEAGLGQCVAQMVAARLYNERDNQPVRATYGCVTTGETWQFLRLDETNVTIDPHRFYISDVSSILAALAKVVAGNKVTA